VDTRSKILTPAAALQIRERPIAIVTGTFDVLRAAHARELADARTGAARLLVAVLPRAGELLAQRARAELVAALSVVDYVVAASIEEMEGLIRALQPTCLIRMEEGDEGRLRELRELIRSRFTPGIARADIE
jgi:bifunctional ADP-heptose synthase (sugar kinase/adenylyltransferase)